MVKVTDKPSDSVIEEDEGSEGNTLRWRPPAAGPKAYAMGGVYALLFCGWVAACSAGAVSVLSRWLAPNPPLQQTGPAGRLPGS